LTNVAQVALAQPLNGPSNGRLRAARPGP